MEKPLFPSEYMRITQGYDEGTHKSSFAIDNAGKDSGISDIYAPYTGIIKKIYQNDANEVWLESSDKVEYPDGTVDYMTMLFAHANSVDNLFVGKLIKKVKHSIRKEQKEMPLETIAILNVDEEDLVIVVGIKIVLVIGASIMEKDQKRVYG